MNEQIETIGPSGESIPVNARYEPTISPFPDAGANSLITPQGGCGGAQDSEIVRPDSPVQTSFVYAIGRIEARFPTLGAEKEFAQATSQTPDKTLTNQQIFHTVLSDPANRHIPRQLCWVFSIQGLDTYLLVPRDSNDIDLLVEAIRPEPRQDEIDVVIGIRGPISPPTACNGLMLPMVIFDHIYSFNQSQLMDALQYSGKNAKTRPAADEMFNRIMQMTDNAGSTDEHRALNYLAMRYPAIYTKAAEQNAREYALTGVDVVPSPLGGTRKLVDVVFTYTSRSSQFEEKFYVCVDVSEEFPFLHAAMRPAMTIR